MPRMLRMPCSFDFHNCFKRYFFITKATLILTLTLILSLVLALPLPVLAQPAATPTGAPLLAAYQAALAYDASFLAAKTAVDASKEKPIQAQSTRLPSINVLAAANLNYAEFIYTNAHDRDYAGANLSLAGTYPIWRPALGQLVTQADLGVRLTQANFANTQQDLIVRVAQAYFDVLLTEDTLASIATQKAAIAEQLAQAKREFEVGTKTILDTNEAQSRYDAMLAQEAIAQGDYSVKRTAFMVLTGQTNPQFAPLRTNPTIALPQPEDVNAWVSRAQEANIGVQMAQLTADLAQSEIKRNQLNQKLTVDVVGSVAYNRTVRSIASTMRSNTGVASIGVQLNYPLYSGGNLDSKVREAALLYDKSKADLEAARRTAGQAARQTYLGLTYGIAQIKALESALHSTKTLLDSTKLGYQVGVRINLDVLNAQQALATTQTQLSKARYDALMAGLRLKAITTQLTQNDILALNAQLILN